MKIQTFANVFRLPGGVASKRNEGEGGSGRNAYDPNQTRQDSSQSSQQDKGRDEKKDAILSSHDPQVVTAAIADFHADPSTRAHGLSAVIEGSGPGLKITVKDANGNRLRQFTKEEFLKMRGAGSQQPSLRGKILDQKL